MNPLLLSKSTKRWSRCTCIGSLLGACGKEVSVDRVIGLGGVQVAEGVKALLEGGLAARGHIETGKDPAEVLRNG
jgi:hypothetical protein